VEVGLVHRGTAETHGLARSAWRIRFDFPVLPILPLVMGLGPKVDLVLISVIAEEQSLRAVGNQDERIVGKGHSGSPLGVQSEREAPNRRSHGSPQV